MISNARHAAERYVELVNDRDLDGLAELFAPEAELYHPVGEFAGHDGIRKFYAENVLLFSPHISAVSWVDEEPVCVFEMEARAPGSDAVAHAIDHLTVDDGGLIGRLAIYYR